MCFNNAIKLFPIVCETGYLYEARTGWRSKHEWIFFSNVFHVILHKSFRKIAEYTTSNFLCLNIFSKYRLPNIRYRHWHKYICIETKTSYKGLFFPILRYNLQTVKFTLLNVQFCKFDKCSCTTTITNKIQNSFITTENSTVPFWTKPLSPFP